MLTTSYTEKCPFCRSDNLQSTILSTPVFIYGKQYSIPVNSKKCFTCGEIIFTGIELEEKKSLVDKIHEEIQHDTNDKSLSNLYLTKQKEYTYINYTNKDLLLENNTVIPSLLKDKLYRDVGELDSSIDANGHLTHDHISNLYDITIRCPVKESVFYIFPYEITLLLAYRLPERKDFLYPIHTSNIDTLFIQNTVNNYYVLASCIK